jgi:hypothetical protein
VKRRIPVFAVACSAAFQLSSFAKGGGPAFVVAVACSFVLSFRSEAEESAVAAAIAFAAKK